MVSPELPEFPTFPPANDEANQKPISFLQEDTDFEPSHPDLLSDWITRTIQREGGILRHITFIFCSDDYLYQMNLKYLQHDTLTDVITFPYLPPPNIQGDIFISVDRVRDNAATYKVTFEQELHRVMIHGVLHLCGYTDNTPEAKAIMTRQEDQALAMLPA